MTSDVHLREITPDNQAAVEALVVSPAQSTYVASVADSIVEAAEVPEACPWYRAVYDGDQPVGFVMISDNTRSEDPTIAGPYFLWRLLVALEHQGKGYGAATLGLIIDYVRTRPDAQVLLTSVVDQDINGPHSPLGFYLRQGFRLTGEVHGGEPLLELDLWPASGGGTERVG